MSVLYFELLIIELYIATVKPLYNGQVGAGAFVHYLEVSFIWRCRRGLSLKLMMQFNVRPRK